MALATRLQQPNEDTTPTDITSNLYSLQFESALRDEEKQLQYLRKHAHALTVTSCAQATFFVSILNEARELHQHQFCNHVFWKTIILLGIWLAREKSSNTEELNSTQQQPQKRSTRILQDSNSKDPLKIGILGCGRLGSQLAQCFITFGNVNPKDLKISTRRPETLEDLQKKGVECFCDNVKLVTTTHIVFVCVLPAQVPHIADEVKTDIPSALLIYSFASSVSAKKLCQLFGTNNVIHPDYTWDSASKDADWNYTISINSSLENKQIVATTCPLRKQLGIITTSPKLAELMIFALVNMCTNLKLTKYEGLDVLHNIIFNNATQHRLELNDFIRKTADKDEMFPQFDLLKVLESNTAVLKRMMLYADLYDAFVKKYSQVFDDYLKQQLYNEMYKL